MFESFNDFIKNEARDFNDPLLIKMRAAQMKANKKAAEDAEKKAKELSPAKKKKIAKLKAEREDILKQMDLEAGMMGDDWDDDMANSYGEALNDIDKEIIKLGGNPMEYTTNESKIQLKRKYTENHPAITAGKFARVRNKMLEAIGDGKITQEEFESILKEFSNDSKRWSQLNKRYFSVSEDGISLSNFGKKILSKITVNENMDKFIFESFSEFTSANKGGYVRESEQLITEGTRGQFGKIYKNGEIASVYTHYDSYPEHMLAVIKKGYKKGTDVDVVLGKGDNSGLEVSPDKMKFYGDPDSMKPMKGNVKNINKYIKDADRNGGAEYIYLFDERDQNWYMVDVYGGGELVPAFESFSNEGEEINEREFVYTRSKGFKMAADRIEQLSNQLDPNSMLCKNISSKGDNVKHEFKVMKDHIDRIYTIWQDIEYMIDMQYESVEPLCEAEVEMDAMDPDNKDFLKFLKKHRVKIIDKSMEGPGGNIPVILMQGKRKDLEAVLADCEYGWCDEELAEYIEESASVNENKYADAGKLGYNDQFLDRRKSLSKTLSLDLGLNPKHEFGGGDWLGFDYVSLYATGGKKAGTIISDALTGKYTYDELKAAAAKFLGIKESVEVNEAFKSSKLRNLMNMNAAGTSYGSKIHNLTQAFYGLTGAKLDQIGDEHLIDYADPEKAAKEFKKDIDTIVFYIVDNEKENPYADRNSYNDMVRPGILGISKGGDFLTANYHGAEEKYKNRKATYGMSISKDKSDAIGGNKKYKGYGASGLYTVKRVAELSDRAVVINLAALRGGELDARPKVQARAEAQEGAIAFKSDKDFKAANLKRYKDILATKASKLPLDKIVEDSINMLTKHIADAMKSGEKTKYNEIKIGEDKKGREIKITDAANIMSGILGDYERYVRYMADAEKEKDSGYSSGYYEKEAKEYAKRVSDKAKKVKDMDYAW